MILLCDLQQRSSMAPSKWNHKEGMMGSGFAKKKKEARNLQEKFEKMQEELKNQTVEGVSGAGLVKVTLNGENEMLHLSIKPECVDREDIETLEDLIKAAYADAKKKLKDSTSKMSPFGGASPFSGLGF